MASMTRLSGTPERAESDQPNESRLDPRRPSVWQTVILGATHAQDDARPSSRGWHRRHGMADQAKPYETVQPSEREREGLSRSSSAGNARSCNCNTARHEPRSDIRQSRRVAAPPCIACPPDRAHCPRPSSIHRPSIKTQKHGQLGGSACFILGLDPFALQPRVYRMARVGAASAGVERKSELCDLIDRHAA